MLEKNSTRNRINKAKNYRSYVSIKSMHCAQKIGMKISRIVAIDKQIQHIQSEHSAYLVETPVEIKISTRT